ncbi:uncharacterized protein LOC106672027 isoform X2 [Cimex lectularius]|uniref:Uncharacterized protein n=1 Tax=Cimex lectularius TaxID=79782 RepID=A0A8I6S453_CIMLE|nr:uncharacterized protein LOC106672027 isoform X2 [Cimex lectularius]
MNPNSEWDDENDETIVFDSDAAKESIKNIKCTFIKLVLNQISRLKKSVNESSQEFETSESLKIKCKKLTTGYTKSSQSFRQSNVNTTKSLQSSKIISKSESQVTGVIECGEDPIISPARQHLVKSVKDTQHQQEPSPPQLFQQQPQGKPILKFLKAALLLAFILWGILFVVSFSRQQLCYHFPIRCWCIDQIRIPY